MGRCSLHIRLDLINILEGILGILLQVPKHIWGETSERQSDALKDIVDTLDFLVSGGMLSSSHNPLNVLNDDHFCLAQALLLCRHLVV